MQNITQYSDQALTLLVMNTEYLYVNRHDLTKNHLSDLFIFTDTQWECLQQDLRVELSEEYYASM